MWAIVFFELIILAVICIFLMRVFVSFKRTPWYALATTWLGWLLCFSIVFLIPIDILDTDHETCVEAAKNNSAISNPEDVCKEPITYLPETVMIAQWKVLWWGTMILSWLVFPLLSSYFLAGEFTVLDKFVRSVKENIVIYLALAILGIIGVIVLLATTGLTGDAFFGFVLALANAYGLILTICLLGYGLVDIPRYLWRKANRSSTLHFYYVQAYKYKESIEEAKTNLFKTLKLVKTIADKVHDHDPYRPYVDIILSKCPKEYDDVVGDADIDLTYSKLVSVHQKVAEDTHSVLRAVCLYEKMLIKAFKTEDIVRTKLHPQSDWKIYWSFFPARTHRFAKIVDTIEYVWEVYLFTTGFRILSVLAALLSLGIVWCELTLTTDHTKHDLSPFSQVIHKIPLQGLAKQIFCLIIIFYMAVCAYTTLFKLKLFNYYRLVPHQMSDANSIMFSANYLCRLAAPLSYNFLRLINAEDHSFSAVMGTMDAFPVLGDKFTIFFPVFVVILCIATIFNVYSRIGAMCCIKSLQYRPDNDEKLVEEGERILQEERDNKEGIAMQTTKQAIRSTVKEEVSKIARKGKEEKEEKEAYEQQKAASAAPAAPTSLSSKIAQKYGLAHSDDDLLPPTSRFATKRITVATPDAAPSSGSNGGMRSNLSGGNLAAQGGASTSVAGSSMRFNLSGNNLSGSTGSTASTGSGMRFNLSNNSLSSGSTGSSSGAPAAGSLLPPTSRFAKNDDLLPPTSRFARNDDLLPPTSRFAKKSPIPPPPAPAPASAILVSAPSEAPSRNDTKSLLGGLFGKKNNSFLSDSGSNL